jgi:hypothetical protein
MGDDRGRTGISPAHLHGPDATSRTGARARSVPARPRKGSDGTATGASFTVISIV